MADAPMGPPRWFIALLPPPAIAARVDALTRDLANRWGNHRALRSPPHVTLIPPFSRSEGAIAPVQSWLAAQALGHDPFGMDWRGWGCFAPRVVYLDVPLTDPLQQLQRALREGLRDEFAIEQPRDQGRPFRPHVTLAFCDRRDRHFEQLWHDVQGHTFAATFTVRHLTLLRDDGNGWSADGHYPLAANTVDR